MLTSIIPAGSERVLIAIGGAVGGAMSFAFGDVGPLLVWLSVFVILDFFTGTFAALRNGAWSSAKNFVGVFKKIFVFVMVALAHGLDTIFVELIHIEIFQSIVICAYAAGEFGSIVENLEKAGCGGFVPPVIRRLISAMNTQIDDAVEKIEGERHHAEMKK